MRIVTAQEMKQIEKNAAQSGLSYYQMMENAGAAAVSFILENLNNHTEHVLILTGKGNNGGDGFVTARLLTQRGYTVEILMVDGIPVTEDAKKNYNLCAEMNLPIHTFATQHDESFFRKFTLIIDALYGTGFHGNLHDTAAAAAAAVNAHIAAVVALDIPSGVNGDTAEADTNAIRANYTIAFDSLKHAHVAHSAAVYCGEVICADIGIPESCHALE